jgi:hypothetical protein
MKVAATGNEGTIVRAGTGSQGTLRPGIHNRIQLAIRVALDWPAARDRVKARAKLTSPRGQGVDLRCARDCARMKFVLQPRGQNSSGPGCPPDPTQYVRKNWGVFALYYLGTSLALGICLTAIMFGVEVSKASEDATRKPLPAHNPVGFLITMAGVVSVPIILVQLVTGPFVFTRDVVCRTCRRRLKVKRIAFFAGRYSRPPRCECGGKIEPAFLWRPEIAERNASRQ